MAKSGKGVYPQRNFEGGGFRRGEFANYVEQLPVGVRGELAWRVVRAAEETLGVCRLLLQQGKGAEMVAGACVELLGLAAVVTGLGDLGTAAERGTAVDFGEGDFGYCDGCGAALPQSGRCECI